MLSKSSKTGCGIAESFDGRGATKKLFQVSFLKEINAVIFFLLMIPGLFLYTVDGYSAEHNIQLKSEETGDDGFGNKLLAYKMSEHKVDGVDITNRYSTEATIPGPTLFLTEGDVVNISIVNEIPGNQTSVPGISKQVSIHVHGVHYDILSDGTLKVINKHDDEGSGAGLEEGIYYHHYSYKWNVAHGTAGTWAYHDHNYESHNGSENRGLFGAIIVSPKNSPKFDKEYVLYLGDDAFWGMEIDGSTNKQSKHGVNPSLTAAKNSDVRFHLIAMGTDLHQFVLPGYSWTDPGTNQYISRADIGPLEKHVFSVKAKESSQYFDANLSNWLLGMKGNFQVH